MTHNEILTSITKISSATVGDYISMALAQGWTRTEIAEALTKHIEGMEGVNCWSKITRLVDRYEKYYSVGSEDEPDLYADYDHGGNPDFIGRKRPVEIDGVVYESMKAAAEALGKTKRGIEHLMENGVKVYSYDGKIFRSKDALKKTSRLTEGEYRKMLDGGLVKTWRQPLGRYL